jgi:NADH-quinone oxidoreductase subunit N
MFLVENQIKFFAPEFFFASVLLFIVLQNSLIIDNKNYKNPLLVSITLQISSLTFLTFLGLLLNSCAVNFFMFSESNFIFDALGLNVKLFLTFFSIIVFLFCFDHIYETKINLFEYVFLKLLAVLSLCFLVMANDLLGIYIIIEIQSLCLYALASFKRNSAFSTEAGIKYFVLGSFASCFLLIGIATIYCSIGSTNLQDVQYLLTSLNKTILFFDTINIGLFFIASSFLFKLAIFPFHLWIADVYEGSSTSSSIFFSLIPKIAIFVVLIRIFEYSFYSTFYN